DNFYIRLGIIYITNKRLIYIPQVATPFVKSFNVSLDSIKDEKLTKGWFGSPTFTCSIIPTSNGGLAKAGQLKLTFKKGKDFEFKVILKKMKAEFGIFFFFFFF
ncbi:hypothetical protein BCR36DRAFT_291701, partial [Piromyces finnis]